MLMTFSVGNGSYREATPWGRSYGESMPRVAMEDTAPNGNWSVCEAEFWMAATFSLFTFSVFQVFNIEPAQLLLGKSTSINQ